MKDTLIVFIGITVLLLLPLLFYGIRSIVEARRKKDNTFLYHRLVAVWCVSFAVIILFVGLYKFTLKYQPPLVVEKFLRDEGYGQLEDTGLNIDEYNVYLSENTYQNDDGTMTIYSCLESDVESIYTIINLKRDGDIWRVSGQEIITGDYENYPEVKKRFYPIKGRP